MSFLSLAVTPSSDVKVYMSGIREVLVNQVSSLLLNIKKKKVLEGFLEQIMVLPFL